MSEKNGSSKVEFAKPAKVHDVCETMQTVESRRALDRANINTLFNGQTPYSKADVEKYKIQINVNWGLGKRMMIDANRQVNNALLHQGILFTCAAESGKKDKREEWSLKFTKNIHKPLQRGRSGRRFHFLIRSRNAALCMHGIGPLLWSTPWDILPRFMPLEDLLIPTDTYCDYSNMRYTATNLYLTPGELADMTQGDTVQKQWDQKMVREVLNNLKVRTVETGPSNWRDRPEEMVQVWKQDRGYYYSDEVPKVKMRMFYFQQIDKPQKWYRVGLLREAYGNADVNKFIYDGTSEPFADNIDHILHTQFGDSNYVAPLTYHAVRGLGVDLFAPVDTLNRLQCEFVQHVFEQLKMYFRIQDPADRDRLKQVVLSAYGYIPEGLNIVKRDERHQIDAGLVQMAMAQMRQVVQESSASFVQDSNDGTEKEMTAFEANARLNQATVMVSGMLQLAYIQEAFLYEEIVRRFLIKGSKNPHAIAFRKACLEDGIPEEMMDAEKWRVTPERVLGGGDRTLAQAEAQWLVERINMFDPQAQQRIKRLAVLTVLNDPAKADLFVPETPPESTNGARVAEGLFGTLMQGVEVSMHTGIDQQGYIAAMLRMMNSVVQIISQTDQTGTLEQIIGLQMTAQDVARHIMLLAGDESQKETVAMFGKAMGETMNQIKTISQRLMKSMEEQQQAQGDPEAQAKAESTIMMARIKGQINQENAALKRQIKMMDFEMNSQIKTMEALAETKRADLKSRQELMDQSSKNSLAILGELRTGRTKQMVALSTAKTNQDGE